MGERARKIIIIGAGPAGMCAGIFAARAGADVLIFEHGPEPGRKILATGGGRCNLTNAQMGAVYYPGSDRNFVKTALDAFGPEKTAAFFDSIGLFTADRGGYLYPRTMTAATVRKLLCAACEADGVRICTGVTVQGIRAAGGPFSVFVEEGAAADECLRGNVSEYRCERVILACGGIAAPATGSDGSGFRLAEGLGLPVTQPLPALVPLIGETRRFRALAGLRMNAKASLFVNDKYIESDTGEVQFTKDTVSGIPVFDISGSAVRALSAGKPVRVVFDLLPEFAEKQLIRQLFSRPSAVLRDAAAGLLPAKACEHFLHLSGLADRSETPLSEVGEDRVRSLIRLLKDFSVGISGHAGCERAQTSTGGIDPAELDPHTMESKRVPGLCIAGEMIDVTGICGGYNLQWAWTTGALAGKAAAR